MAISDSELLNLVDMDKLGKGANVSNKASKQKVKKKKAVAKKKNKKKNKATKKKGK